MYAACWESREDDRMIPALVLGAIAGAIGWLRATRRGGSGPDKVQYAMAHGFPAFILGMIFMTVAANLGWLG